MRLFESPCWHMDEGLYDQQPCNHPPPYRYEPKNDPVALATARAKAAYDAEHRWDGLRDALAEAYMEPPLSPDHPFLARFMRSPSE